LPKESQLTAAAVEPSVDRDALGRPVNTQQMLVAGLADASESLARGVDLNGVIRVVLETIHSGLGFARTALVMRDAATGAFRTRACFGNPRPAFSFTTAGNGHLFVAALAQTIDLHIADVTAEKIRAALPIWFAREFPTAKSFLLMPLAVGGRAVGFFYADRTVVDPKGLSPEELSLVRSLRNQVVLAMRTR
jgi:GAF domain-containing protein